MDSRLSTKIWLEAHFRQLQVAGIPYTVVRRGEAESGTVALKVLTPDRRAQVYTQARDEAGELVWMVALAEPLPEAEADAYLARLMARDPDVWVVEIESREGVPPFPAHQL